MIAPFQIFVGDSQCEIKNRAIGVTPLEKDLRAAIEVSPSRELDKRGLATGVEFERRVVLYDDLGLSFCYNKEDGKVVWLMADFNKADWRRTAESDLAYNFEGRIRIGDYTVNRTIRWRTFDETVETSLRDISVHAAPCNSGMISSVTIGFPKNEEGEQAVHGNTH
jgi:hypothetical protein